MAITVTQLVTQAFNITGMVSRDFQTLEGNQLILGRQILDDLLGEKLIDDVTIPYYTEYEFNAVAGQEEYFVENLIEVDTFTFVKDTVRYSTRWEGRREYFGTPRANDISSLPFEWHFERTLNGSNFFMYFLPDEAYPCTIWGKFGLAETTGLTQDLLVTYDRYYVTFLKYELALRLCAEYNYTVPLEAQRTYDKLRYEIQRKSAKLDLTLERVSTLDKPSALTYAQVNLGRGWQGGNW